MRQTIQMAKIAIFSNTYNKMQLKALEAEIAAIVFLYPAGRLPVSVIMNGFSVGIVSEC